VSAVIDANIVIAAATPSPRRTAARYRLERWLTYSTDLHAPQLLVYEVASALTGLESTGVVTPQASDDVWRLIDALDLTLHPASSGAALIAIALRLHRRSAYDAAYIDLALVLRTELWTLDAKLTRNATAAGFPVNLVV